MRAAGRIRVCSSGPARFEVRPRGALLGFGDPPAKRAPGSAVPAQPPRAKRSKNWNAPAGTVAWAASKPSPAKLSAVSGLKQPRVTAQKTRDRSASPQAQRSRLGATGCRMLRIVLGQVRSRRSCWATAASAVQILWVSGVPPYGTAKSPRLLRLGPSKAVLGRIGACTIERKAVLPKGQARCK